MKNVGRNNLHDFVAEFIFMRWGIPPNILDNARKIFLAPVWSRPTYDPAESEFSERKDTKLICGYIYAKVIARCFVWLETLRIIGLTVVLEIAEWQNAGYGINILI